MRIGVRVATVAVAAAVCVGLSGCFPIGVLVTKASNRANSDYRTAVKAAAKDSLDLDLLDTAVAIDKYREAHPASTGPVSAAILDKNGATRARTTLGLQIHYGSDYCIDAHARGIPSEKIVEDASPGPVAGSCIAGTDY